jgi:hypothetical protein
MPKPETMKPPEYSSWLIRNADQMTVNIGAGWAILALINFNVLGNPDVTQFTRVSVLMVNAIVSPLVYSALCVILLRGYRVEERIIKYTAVIVLFVSMVLGVLFVPELDFYPFFFAGAAFTAATVEVVRKIANAPF